MTALHSFLSQLQDQQLRDELFFAQAEHDGFSNKELEERQAQIMLRYKLLSDLLSRHV